MSTEKKETNQMSEERKRFIEVAQRRVSKAIAIIQSLEDFTSKNYEYTKEDVTKIQVSLRQSVDDVCSVLVNPKKQKTLFEL